MGIATIIERLVTPPAATTHGAQAVFLRVLASNLLIE